MKSNHPLRTAAAPLCLVVALGTRGDVQPLACLALQLQTLSTPNDLRSCCPEDNNQPGFRVCFITHTAHSSWLSSPPYDTLFHVQLIPSAPAGKWWEEHSHTQPCRSPTHSPADPPCTVCARDPSHGSCSSPPSSHHPVTRPDSTVIEAMLHCLTTYPDYNANQAVDTPSCPGPCPVAGRAAAASGPPASRPPSPALHPATQQCTAQQCTAQQEHSHLPSDASPSVLPEAAAPATTDVPGAAAPSAPAACDAAEGSSPPPGDTHPPPRQAGEQPLRAMVLFNLFALEAYHVAEALQLPCAVAAPYTMPYSCPSAFIRSFATELPELHAALVAAQQHQRHEQVAGSGTITSTAGGGCSMGGESAGSSSAPWPRVTFAEVQHWMWPLFTERWGEWRQGQLGLPPLPLHHPASHRPLAGRGELPPAPPLLYGFSEQVVPRPSFWPPSVHVCGFWQPPQSWFTGQSLPEELETVLWLTQPEGGRHRHGGCSTGNSPGTTLASGPAAATPPSSGPPGGWRGVVCVDFGSMGRMGLLPASGLRRLLGVLCGALAELGMLGVFLTAAWELLHAAAAELHAANEGHGAGGHVPQGQREARMRTEGEPLGQSCQYGEAEAAGEPHQKRPRHDGAPDSQEPVARYVDAPVRDTRALDGVHAEAGCGREGRWCRAYGGSLYLHPRPVPHQLLLPRCALLLHHGGSGTTAAALQCGTPQLVCPLQFDQHYWAERLAYMALSPPPLEREQLFGSTFAPELPANTANSPWAGAVTALAAAMRDALSDERRRAVADLAQELRREDGLDAAARVVRGAFTAHMAYADADGHCTDM